MAETYRTAPEDTDKMPAGIPYIVGNEAAERFSFYGMKAILMVFMTKHLLVDEHQAESYVHTFNMANYGFPLLGAIVADAWWGKYRTILWLSLAYCAGHLVISGWLTLPGLLLGLFLIAVGSGGIKPCVSAHVGDQFGTRNKDLLPRVYGWFYFSINFGSFFSTLLTPWLLSHKDFGAEWAFGVPALLMAIATLVFWMGRNKYAHIPPVGPGVWVSCLTGERLRILLRMAGIFLFMSMFWAIYDQTSSVWVVQAAKMNKNFGWFALDESQMQAINPILVMAYIPLFTMVIYPLMGQWIQRRPLWKLVIGFYLTALTAACTAVVESWITAGHEVHAIWQVALYVILTAAEVMAYFTALEFAYTQAPPEMKSMVMAINLASVSVGNAFTALVTGLMANVPSIKTALAGERFHWFYCILMTLTATAFVYVAATYRGKTYLQDATFEESQAAPEPSAPT